jgi:IS605 OrfB family transposase
VKASRTARWYAHINVKVSPGRLLDVNKPPAVVSIDLGMKKSATAVLLTPEPTLKKNNIRFFTQPDKKKAINTLDNTITSLQRKKALYEQTGISTKQVVRKLIELSHKRHDLAEQYDHKLTADISRWIDTLGHSYCVYVAIGKLKGIRSSRRKSGGESRKHRRELHSWSFSRITGQLQYKLARIGFPLERFVPVRESWTSKICWKCGSTDTSRPFQSLVICHACGAQLQADINGAMNIGFKLVFSLVDEASLDQWLTNPLLDKKSPSCSVSVAGRKTSCTRESSLISSPPSGDERPVVVPVVWNPQVARPLGNFLGSSLLQNFLVFPDFSRFCAYCFPHTFAIPVFYPFHWASRVN